MAAYNGRGEAIGGAKKEKISSSQGTEEGGSCKKNYREEGCASWKLIKAARKKENSVQAESRERKSGGAKSAEKEGGTRIGRGGAKAPEGGKILASENKRE